MKKLSLQWRLTLTTALLVAAACLVLNLFISHSAIMHIDEVGKYVVEVEPAGQEPVVIGVDDTGLSAQVQLAKDTFRAQSILATVAIILLSSLLTWFLSGRALAPVRKLSAHMETIQAQNLSEPLEMPGTQDEVARLTRSFNGMLERLDQAFTAQRQFSANAAHELRTPLAVMQTSLEVLQKREEPTIEEYADAVRMTVEQTGRLSHLVGTLLEMTELQTVQRTDKIALSALVEEVICDLTQVADEREVTLIQTPGEAETVGNDPLLYRAIYNLVENAIKYNRPGGTVTVGVEAENGAAVVSVSDTGIGIGREYWESVFDPFVRVDKSRSRAMGGAGLGLALVRDIAVQHGGTVNIVHSSDKGTEIVLTLPTSESLGWLPCSVRILNRSAAPYLDRARGRCAEPAQGRFTSPSKKSFYSMTPGIGKLPCGSLPIFFSFYFLWPCAILAAGKRQIGLRGNDISDRNQIFKKFRQTVLV